MNKQKIKAEVNNIAFCGLYCEACGRFAKGKCPGCEKNEKASWCGARKCCMEHGYKSCADCTSYADVRQCKEFHNPISRVIGFVLRSDRPGSVDYIRKNGYKAYAELMSSEGRMTIKR